MGRIQLLYTAIKDPYRKSLGRMIIEAGSLFLRERKIPYHYFTRFLYRKNIRNYKDYLSTPEYFRIIRSGRVQNPEAVAILSNKIEFDRFCQKHKLPGPRTLGYNTGHQFFSDGLLEGNFKTRKEVLSFISRLFEEIDGDFIIAKNASTRGGASIFKLHREEIQLMAQEVCQDLLNGSFVYQELIRNHPEVDKIYPHSLNTIRFDTLLNAQNQAEIIGAFYRFGSGQRFVDNVSQGGVFTPIDLQNGQLKREGYTDLKGGGRILTKHPDTGYEFDRFQIPFFMEAVELCTEITVLLNNKIVGWDIAITEIGPLVIEGNHDTNFTVSEIGYGGYRNRPGIQYLLKLADASPLE